MSDTQIFQIFSLAYLAIGIGIFINPNFYKRVFEDFTESPTALYFGGFMALLIGYLIVAFHNTWACLQPVNNHNSNRMDSPDKRNVYPAVSKGHDKPDQSNIEK